MALINPPPIRQSAVSQIINGIAGIMPNSWASWANQVYVICFSVQESGTTSLRPTNNLWVGRPYFDTTLGYIIHYDGSVWVDGAGNSV